MKKIFLILFLLIGAQLFAYSYPFTFSELMQKFYEENQKIILVLSNKEYRGTIILALDDYFVFRLEDGGVIIILYSAVTEVSAL